MTARKMRVTVVAAVVALSGAMTAVSLADTSPGGHNAAPWPAQWSPYTWRDGTAVADPAGDSSPGYTDLVTGPTGDEATLQSSFDGENLFFRLRLGSDPNRTETDFSSAGWLVALGVNGVYQGAVGLDGKPPGSQTEYVYVTNADGSVVTHVYEDPFTDGPINNSKGVRATEQDASGNWFLDVQVPVEVIFATTGVEPGDRIQLFAGTSTSNNLAVINKDWMVGDQIAFTGLAARQLAGARMRMSAFATLVDGPNPPEVAAPSRYDVSIKVRNPGLNALADVVITDSVAPGVIIDAVSGDGSITHDGVNVSWEPPDVAPGTEASAMVTVIVTPGLADLGNLLDLDVGAVGASVDASTGQRVGSVAEIVQVGPVAPVSGVSLAKSFLDAGTIVAGDGEQHQLALTAGNEGPSFLTGIAITDEVDAALDVISTNCSLLGGTDLTVGNTVLCEGLELDPGGSSTLEVLFEVPETADTSSVENTATLAASELTDSVASAVAVLEIVEDVHLEVDKSFTPASMSAGAVGGSFTITVLNAGVSDADNVVVSDLVDSRLAVTGVSTDLGSCMDTDGSASTVECGVDVLGSGDSVLITVFFDPGATATPGSIIVNQAHAISDESPAAAASPMASLVINARDPLPPTANDDVATTASGTAVTILVLANDADPEGDAVTVSSVTAPGSGIVAINDGGTVTYTPGVGFVGQESFSYEACESEPAEPLCDSAAVIVTVVAVDLAPTLNAGAATIDYVTVGGTPRPLPVSDPEGSSITSVVILGAPPPGVTLGSTGTFVGSATVAGAYVFTVEVCDTTAHCAAFVYAIVVE